MKNIKLRIDLLKEASKDFKYLLTRGYNRTTSLKFVSDRYLLSKTEKMALYRGVFSDSEIKLRKSKLVSIKDIIGEKLVVDGFNVLMTIKAALLGTPLIKCQDGFIRDILSSFEKVKINDLMYISLEILLCFLNRYKPKKVTILFDSKVSKSGCFAAHVRRKLNLLGINGTALAVPRADTETLAVGRDEIIASSDTVIILKANKVVDLGGYIASFIAPERILIL